MKAKQSIEIFCGTGGVGKTTLSAARAVSLANQGLKVLLITIDPAKRLKQVLQMEKQAEGEVHSIPADTLSDSHASFDALLLLPYHTLKRIADRPEDAHNPILKILTRPTGGMNEIMAIVELQYQFNRNHYDIIVLDTPPGRHFLDFLMATGKIKSFFNKAYIDIFNYLGKTIHSSDKNEKKRSSNPLKALVGSGINKLMGYLESVTGGSFVNQFVDAIITIYRNKDSFLAALDFQEQLKENKFCRWLLVTSVEQLKIQETAILQSRALELLHGNSELALNKCLSPHLSHWSPQDTDLKMLKTSLLKREEKLKSFAQNFKQVLEFPEVLSASPQTQVTKLASLWDQV